MNVKKTGIEGVLIIEPRLFRDARGYFFESFSERAFKEKAWWWYLDTGWFSRKDWRIPTEHANLSEKDTKHQVLKDFESPFEY